MLKFQPGLVIIYLMNASVEAILKLEADCSLEAPLQLEAVKEQIHKLFETSLDFYSQK